MTLNSVSIQYSQALIGNKWWSGDRTFKTVNPSTGEVIAEVTDSNEDLVNEAVKSARFAFDEGEWGKMDGYERSALLFKLADLIQSKKEELAKLETLDNGKPIAEARIDVDLTVQCFRFYAGAADKIVGTTIPTSGVGATPENFVYTVREAVGVVGQIIPFNFPLLMAAWKLGPALSAGCSVVLKPAPQTPLTALYLGNLILEAGFPVGAVNIVPGGDEAGRFLSHHSDIDKIAFTGSSAVGKEILKVSSLDLKRVTLELGGKSPMVICSDADLEKAVQEAQTGIYFNQGQVCCASSRIFVHKDIFEEFTQKFVAASQKRKIGSGDDPDTEMGPLVSEEQHERVLNFIKSGLKEGATLACGSDKAARPQGYFVAPTVFTNVTDDMTIAREEIFGPVVCLLKFDDDDEAIRRANDTIYGLSASVITESPRRAHKFIRKLKAGTVWVNAHNRFDSRLPFGGYKNSGMGRELSLQALDNYLETKSVFYEL